MNNSGHYPPPLPIPSLERHAPQALPLHPSHITPKKPVLTPFACSRDHPPPSPLCIPPAPPCTALPIPKLPISRLFENLHGLLWVGNGSK